MKPYFTESFSNRAKKSAGFLADDAERLAPRPTKLSKSLRIVLLFLPFEECPSAAKLMCVGWTDKIWYRSMSLREGAKSDLDQILIVLNGIDTDRGLRTEYRGSNYCIDRQAK
jgi:hypothetical protein